MSSIKKLSFIFVFLALIVSGFFAINLPFKQLNALENDTNILLSVQKIRYTTNVLTKDENGRLLGDTNNNGILDGEESASTMEFDSIGKLKPGELYNNDLGITTISSLNNNEVTSINKDDKEAILVKFMPNSEYGSIIKILNPSLKINGTSLLINTYSILGNSENRIFIMAFDFSSLEDNLGQEFTNLAGKYELVFNYSYTTNGTNVISGTTSFNFYLISDNDYFSSNTLPNIPQITNNNDKVVDLENENNITYYYNYQDANNTPKLVYNPKKFQPTINFTYNETTAVLTTSLNEDGTKVVVNSSNEQILQSYEIIISDKIEATSDNENTVSIELNRLGLYNISYNLVVDNKIAIEVISSEQTAKLENFPTHKLYIYGFEAYYTHYDENDSKINYYKQFHNSDYLSDFSYKINGATTLTSAIDNLTTEDISKIAVTNQAPVKIDAYITELKNASYIKLNDDLSVSASGTEKTFSTSKRFGSDENETGTFAVFLTYNFGKRANLSQLIVFKIENSTPNLTFSDINDNPLPDSNFTNGSVKVIWSGINTNPFSVAPQITFTKNGTIVSNLKIDSTKNGYSTTITDSGEYLVTIKYGINLSTSVTKIFTIDKEAISFHLYSVNKNLETNSYEINNKLDKVVRQDNVIEYQTNSPFSIFALNKAVSNNKISVKWEYLPIDSDENSISYEFVNDKLYIYNNRKLSNLYTDLDYVNIKLNNLTSFTEINGYTFANNNTAVVNIAGLHKFTIKDYAGNIKTVFVMLDNTAPIVLHTNDVYSNSKDYNESEEIVDSSLNAWLESRNLAGDLKIKSSGRNLVSNDYSLIVGNGKFVKFDTSIAPNFANEYFGTTIDGVQNIYQDYENFKFIQLDGADLTTNTLVNANNIVFVTAPKDELEANFKASFTLNGKEYFREFNLNTDKNQILIYGYNETDGYYRIYTNDKENITNAKYLYIRFIDEADDEYQLAELTLSFRPFVENNADENNPILQLGTTTTIDLLAIKQTNNIATNEANGVLGGGYITSLINPTFKNNEYVTNQGKYILTKTYKGYNSNPTAYPQVSQTFYVDRHLPIEVFSSTLTIGSNINFTLNNATLTASNILYYIQNNEDVVTNKLPIYSSIISNNKKYSNSIFSNFIVYYEIYKGNLNENVCVYSSDTTSPYYIANGYTFTTTGLYTFRIFDNSGYKFGENNNTNPNSLTFTINITNQAPSGNFVVDDNEEIVETTSSTNSNSLSFVFSDSTSEFLYDIDIYNILLTKNGTNILKTYKEQSTNNSRYTFNLNGTLVYYESSVGGIFKLERTKLSSTKIPNGKVRYSYKLTIIDPSINSELAVDGKSLEAEYKLTIAYTTNSAVLSGENYAQKDYILYIDHTSPYSNVNKYIDSDQFLTAEEKEILKQSVANKDRNSQINFENYTFIINSTPTTFTEGLASLDTSSIYIRKYNKYNDSSIADYQSLVPGDIEYDKQITTRYKFDVNALDANTNKSIYTTASYDTEDLSSFFLSAGFYEIIEIDNAQNYTIYSVYYNPEYTFSVDYSYVKDTASITGGTEDMNNVEGSSVANGLNFKLDNINIYEKDYLNVNLYINGNLQVLRYLPFIIEGTNVSYFTNLDELVTYINDTISSDAIVNALGSQYIIELSNRNGTKITITNNTPNEQISLNIVDYSDYFTVTLPNNDKATFVKEFNVYPVIGGKVSNTALEMDSDGKALTSMPNSSYRFTNKVNNVNISIYYIEWIDNFDRVQYKVKTIGVQDIKYINFGDSPVAEHNGVEYTKNENAKLVYAKNLYSVEIYYSILPDLSTHKLMLSSEDISLQTQITSNIVTNGNLEEINLLQILSLFNGESTITSQVQFTIYLTDLSTLAFNNSANEKIYTITYVYYPTLPSISFIDSASNDLKIEPLNISTTTVSTSKNVTLSYTNNTLFDITITAIREYENDLGQLATQTINNIKTEYTFTELGTYTITVTNILGKQNNYQFSIKTASNKTYAVYTLEANMENFEVSASPVKLTYNIDGNDIPCETYYSIYNTTVEVNTDFNLDAEAISLDEQTNTTVYKIIKKDTGAVYKYIATVKVDYNSNFLKVNDKDGANLQIYKGIDETTNIANNLSGFSIKVTDSELKMTLPLYNGLQGNLINIKMYYNNEPIALNKNIYSSNAEIQTLTLENVPAGVYSFYFEDLAGNTQLFNGNTFLSVYMLTEVITTINGENPIDYQIYNTTVNLKIEQEKQYNTRSIQIAGYKNGNLIEKLTRNTSGEYVFTEYGLYTVQISANITIDGKEQPIYKTLHFTILNENEAYKEFSYIGLNGQTISKILRDGVDITNEIKKFVQEGNSQTNISEFENAILYNLNLATTMKYYYKENGEIMVDADGNEIFDTYNGAGHYQIIVDTQNSLINSQTFSFNVWIRDANVKILLNSSVKEGGSTTKAIKLTYNPYLIYTQIGECSIYLNDTEVIEINSESENAVHSFTIPRSAKGTYIVQVRSDSGNTELSFIVTKKEPLSTVTIIVIVIASVLVSGGIFLFVKLRTKIKVK